MILAIALQPMKIPGYILTFYLILLSAVPCCIFDDCPDDKIALTSDTGQEPDHESGDGDCGSCSPFFSCEGCATATIAFQPVSFDMQPLDISPVYAAYIQPSLPTIDYDFWQPPRLFS